MKIKVVLCNCKGLCPSFTRTDMNTLPFAVESEMDVDYAVVHPQLCGTGGHEALADVMQTADADTWIVCGACAPDTQEKLFQKLMRKHNFPAERFVTVDIRGSDNDGIVDRLRHSVQTIVGCPDAP